MKIRNPIRLKSRSKYGAVKTTVDGIVFDSKKEARRYSELKLLERYGGITDLRVHSLWPIEVNGEKVCSYEADFDYVENGRQVLEDTKGFRTQIYRLKAKLMKAVHGIQIREL